MPAPEFKVNTTRYDPYKNYRFKVKWDNRYVAGISRVGGLTKTTQVVRHRAGGDPGVVRVSPGQTEYGTISLERGVTHDMDFEIWANKVWDYTNSTKGSAPSQIVSLKDFRKDITIELYNEAGQKVIAYNVFRCRIPGNAGAGRRGQCHSHPVDHPGKRGLGTRCKRDRTVGTQLQPAQCAALRAASTVVLTAARPGPSSKRGEPCPSS